MLVTPHLCEWWGQIQWDQSCCRFKNTLPWRWLLIIRGDCREKCDEKLQKPVFWEIRFWPCSASLNCFAIFQNCRNSWRYQLCLNWKRFCCASPHCADGSFAATPRPACSPQSQWTSDTFLLMADHWLSFPESVFFLSLFLLSGLYFFTFTMYLFVCLFVCRSLGCDGVTEKQIVRLQWKTK